MSGLNVTRFAFRGRRFAVIAEDLDDCALPPALTPAEREVARLVHRGLSNRAIADARQTAPRTVANQVASLMRKLAVGSRVELALRLDRSRAAK